VRFLRFEAGRQLGGNYNPGLMHVVLQSGLMGTIPEDLISDQWTRVPTDEHNIPRIPIKEGQIISMRVDKVENTVPFRVEGACRSQDLKSALHRTLAELEKDQEAERQRAAQARQYVKRRIAHPNFKNATFEQVTNILQVAPVGEIVFGPPPKGPPT